MGCRDDYGYPLTTSPVAAEAYVAGVRDLLRLRRDAHVRIASALAHDPTFALAHADLALLGHEMCVDVDIASRLDDARRLAPAPASGSAATSTPSTGTSRAITGRCSRT